MTHVLTYVVSHKCFGIEFQFSKIHLARFDLTKGLVFDDFVIAIWYKLRHCDH